MKNGFSKKLKVAARWLACLLVLALPLHAQPQASPIRLNQVGFYLAAPKLAVVVGAGEGPFEITTPDQKTTVFRGQLGPARYDSLAAQTVRTADFSACQARGTFVVRVLGVGISSPFQVGPNVHEALVQAALKAFYYQRASVAPPPAYAGQWSRPLGHPDTRVLVHASAASPDRPAGTVVSAPRGWYDAGDYNKYVVNSGITLGTLLALYEDFPTYCGRLNAHIPESTNALPDVLDESLWNLRWLLTMQDPADGGVYHKLTNASFDGMVMPVACTTPRYVVQKSTAATLDLAAVLAQASRVFRGFERQTPGLADSCLRAATRAWNWASQHPAVYYDQAALNAQFQPAISTGEYGDHDVRDERQWAAAELYATTKDARYLGALQPLLATPAVLPTWSQVGALATYTLLRCSKALPPAGQRLVPQLRQQLVALADKLASSSSAYQTVMGRSAADYAWGSNSTAANQGIALVQAYRLTGNATYLRLALGNLDYLLGRNATGYCFVTGSGSHSPQHPHHRLSEGDGVAAPVPGLLAGGPNPGRQDGCAYPSTLPALAYSDSVCSYASNEVAINWQAPLVYLAAALEALQPQLASGLAPKRTPK